MKKKKQKDFYGLAACGGVLLLGAGAGWAMGPATVFVDNFTYGPMALTVAVGTRVTWINRDDIPHTVVDADDPRDIHSPPLDTGETYSRSFDKPGTFRYFCSLHPTMQGVVIVK